MSKQLQNRSFHPPQEHCDKLSQYISSIWNGIISLCNKTCTYHQQNITVDGKLAMKNLRTNHEYTDECKKQLSYSTFYKQTDESNLQKQSTKLRNEIMNLKASNSILQKEYKLLSKHFYCSGIPIFYRLPKIQKFYEKYPLLRSIVSGFTCISASLSEYVDSFLKYQAKTC